MTGTLFVVATPIGNLEDMSARAVRALQEVDLIACEDTRQTSKLLNHFGIRTSLTSFHEHNEAAKTRELVEYLASGKRVALVSDAGTPLVSDPGHDLVRKCRQQGIPVVPIPGPSAVVAALSASGLPTDSFLFAGFLPSKSAARRSTLESLALLEATIVLFVSPHKLRATLCDIESVLGDREAYLVREMTKVHETSYYGRLSGIRRSTERETPRGEYTLVLEGSTGRARSEPKIDVEAYLTGLIGLRELSKSQAARRAAHDLGLSRRELYQLCGGIQEGLS